MYIRQRFFKWGIKMNSKSFLKKAVCFSLFITVMILSAYSVLAVDVDGDGVDDGDYTVDTVTEVPDYTEPVVTDPFTEEPTTEYVPETYPTEETTEYEEPTQYFSESEPSEDVTQEYTQQAQNVETYQETTYPQTPTVDKIVSEKKYSTNYKAGMVSWICVGVGVIVVIAVLISTKAGARKTTGR